MILVLHILISLATLGSAVFFVFGLLFILCRYEDEIENASERFSEWAKRRKKESD